MLNLQKIAKLERKVFISTLNLAKIQSKNFENFWVLNLSSRSRSGFYPAAAAVKKVAAKPHSQPPGKNSTAETSNINKHQLQLK